jgi:hypothetical protein
MKRTNPLAKRKVLALCVSIGLVILAIPLYAGAANDMPQEEYSFTIELPELHVVVSYNTIHIYETCEFKIRVVDKITTLPVANANVSFILPIIVLETNEAGVVFFSAPYISKVTAPHIMLEYIESPSDTSCTFPLIATKEGYKTDSINITVHIRSHTS